MEGLMYIDVYKRFIEFWSPVQSNSSNVNGQRAVRDSERSGSSNPYTAPQQPPYTSLFGHNGTR